MIKLTDSQAKILNTIFEENPEKMALKVTLKKRRGEVDVLVNHRLVVEENNRYAATLYGIAHLSTPLAQDRLLLVKRRFEEMLRFHEERKGKAFTSKEFAQRFGVDHANVVVAFRYLFGTYAVPASHSYNPDSGYMGIELGETILDYESFDDLMLRLDSQNQRDKYGHLKPLNPGMVKGSNAPEQAPAKPAKKIGLFGEKWRIVRSLREGGQAWTHVVANADGAHFVGKVLKNLDRKARFEKEVSALNRLSHPNIVKLNEAVFDAEKPYFVMEYCQLGDLEHSKYWVGVHAEIIKLLEQIVDAISYSHSKGLVHRDLKPSNILLRREGEAVLADFGLCFDTEAGDERLTHTKEAIGARHFMAPEMEGGRAENVHAACDVYSVGKLIYWMFSGGLVVPRESFQEDKYNLVLLLGDSSLEHVNRLLADTVVFDPKKRLAVEQLAYRVRILGKLLRGMYNPIPELTPGRCRYCGRGVYKTVLTKHVDVSNFGIEIVGNPKWRVQICNICGNVQHFREEYINGK